MTESVPTFTELTSVYGVDGAATSRAEGVHWAHAHRGLEDLAVLAGTPAAQERYAWLSAGFTERFGAKPTLFARSPGMYSTQ